MRSLWEDYEIRASRCFRFLLSGRLRVHSFLWELKYIRIQAHTNAHPSTNAQPTPRLYKQIMRRLWADYERVIHFELWNRGSEISEKSAWATHVSSLRPDIQSVLTNVRPTKLDTNARDIRGPTDRWVLKGYLWAHYEHIMRGLWD
jgi:hypothetical protein